MVEAWLQRLVEGMQGTMKAVIKRAASNVNEMALADFLFGHPAQVALALLAGSACCLPPHRGASSVHIPAQAALSPAV